MWVGSCASPVAVSEAMSSEVKLVKSSISALSVDVCLLQRACSGLMSFTRAGGVLWWLLCCVSAGRAI